MKKKNFLMMAGKICQVAILVSCLIMIGCGDEPETKPGSLAGKVVILQAYGNAGDEAPNGVSHSFVELYNVSDAAVSLDGVGLYFANGNTVASTNNTADEDWQRIALSGTLPAKTSFLVLGAKHANPDSALLKIEDNYGDINDNDLSLSRRAFKIALIQSTAELTAQNPFTANLESPISGYIDMVGALNDSTLDKINGFETAPARNSASEAVRRQGPITLVDTDNNSKDFINIRYRTSGSATPNANGDPGVLIGTADWLKEHYRPKNKGDGVWEAFAEPTEPEPEDPTQPGDKDALAGKLLILQVGAGSNNATNPVSHSFVELYNAGDTDIELSGYSLQYAAGSASNDIPDGRWTKIDLAGTIKSGHSFLIRGAKVTEYATPVLNLGNVTPDMDENFTLDNTALKVAIIGNTNLLTVVNPFNMDSEGATAADYVDMLGAVNTGNNGVIRGFEADVRDGLTRQMGMRRTSLTDSDNNKDDFLAISYGTVGPDFEKYRPRTHAEGEWDPFDVELPPPVPSEKLMILQANNHGNNNGGFPRSLVELYNNTDDEIDLTNGNYYLHFADNTVWSAPIKIEGTIPAKSSFIIMGNEITSGVTPRETLPTADQTANFDRFASGNNFTVAILRDQSGTLNGNPFGNEELEDDYVDMLGCGTGIGRETATASASAPQCPRRRNLTDTDDNSADFVLADYRNASALPLENIWPRNVEAGPWNPMTGEAITP